MKNKTENNLENIINKCLIIDDQFDEVRDIIFALNTKSISTDYRRDVLDEGITVDPNTRLVIIDLYMSDEKSSIDRSLSSVAFLNENIKGPYFLLIWTKHKSELENFKKELKKYYAKNTNMPLDIEMLKVNKQGGEQDPKNVENVVNEITEYIKNIQKKHKNIYCYMKLSKIFQEQSTVMWDIFLPEDIDEFDPNSLSAYCDEVMSQAFDAFDKSFNFEKSGKGFLNVQAKFLEQELTTCGLDYTVPEAMLSDSLKKIINSKLITHEFTDQEPVHGLPGLIYKFRDSNIWQDKFGKLMEPLIYENEEGENIELTPKELIIWKSCNLNGYFNNNFNRSGIKTFLNTKISDNNNIFESIEKDYPTIKTYYERQVNNNIPNVTFADCFDYFIDNYYIEAGNIIITPYCDFSHNKKEDVLYLPVLIINEYLGRRTLEKCKLFKKNVNVLDLHNGKKIVYDASMYGVCKLEELGEDRYTYYISKEYVNEIQINAANNISRIGTTIIE